MLRKSIAFAFILAFVGSPSVAKDDLDSMQLATALGRLLASEKACGLNYNQDAIRKFIDTKVPASDLQFPAHLEIGVSGSAYSLKQMTESNRVAHCRAIERIAKSHGFI